MMVDGRALASEILTSVRRDVAALGRAVIVRAIVVAPSPATESYLRIKSSRAKEAGMTLEVVRLPDTATTEDAVAAVRAEGADAVIAQLPLPPSIDTIAVLDAIPRGKDADVLSSSARAAFENGEAGALVPPVALSVLHILERHHISVVGKKVTVVGSGWLVGGPVITCLTRIGADITVVNKEKGDLREALKDADIVVSGAGAPLLIKPDMVKNGVVLIDGGTSGLGALVVGDADPAVAEKASLFTPVPGGVGPVAVACLFENAMTLLSRQAGSR